MRWFSDGADDADLSSMYDDDDLMATKMTTPVIVNGWLWWLSRFGVLATVSMTCWIAITMWMTTMAIMTMIPKSSISAVQKVRSTITERQDSLNRRCWPVCGFGSGRSPEAFVGGLFGGLFSTLFSTWFSTLFSTLWMSPTRDSDYNKNCEYNCYQRLGLLWQDEDYNSYDWCPRWLQWL